MCLCVSVDLGGDTKGLRGGEIGFGSKVLGPTEKREDCACPSHERQTEQLTSSTSSQQIRSQRSERANARNETATNSLSPAYTHFQTHDRRDGGSFALIPLSACPPPASHAAHLKDFPDQGSISRRHL